MMKRLIAVVILSAFGLTVEAASPWTGKKVALLGDSITTERQWIDLKQRIFWQYLAEDLGLEPHPYAVSGYQWDRVYKAAQKLKDEMGDEVDAILIFAGTNDYMNGIPLGEWYDEVKEDVNLKGQKLNLPRRYLKKDMKTFKGRINTVMDFLKTNFPDQQIIIMTPIHRGYAHLSDTNIQPEESFPNALGNRFEDYIAALREAADIWSVPLIDLYRESGLYPMNASYAKCFRRGGPTSAENPRPDNLHPNSEGHRRLAKTIAARLLTMPPDHKRPKPSEVSPLAVKVRGYVGRRMDSCFQNHLLKHDAVYLTDPYKDKTEDHYWQCEFWGKWMHSAAPFLSYTGSSQLRANIAASVANLLPCQEECGYLCNYAPTARCGIASKTAYGGWDIWCQKYTLLGLLYVDECLGDKRCLDAACRHLDWLMTQVGPRRKDIGKTSRYHGLASLSILEPVVWLYRKTGKKEYLDFAAYIVSRMDAEEGGGGLISKALADVNVADRTPGKDEWEKFACSRKAYEMLSCYQGLLDYIEVVSEKLKVEGAERRRIDEILKAVVMTAKNVIATELNIVGGAASQELWYHGKDKQTHPYYRMNETCVITTWMRLCESLLAVTGDSSWADELERTFYNIYLAALSRDGSTFAQYTGLEGTRSAGLNNCYMEENCCNANGPRGFVSFMRALVTADKDAARVNLYETSTSSVVIPALKETVTLEMFTLYPKEDRVRIVNRTEKPLDFVLKLRIPFWSVKTEVKVNGEVVDSVVAGKYFELRRRWAPGDKVEVAFDMSCRVHWLNNHVAFTRGPIVLARDARFQDGNLVERMRAIDFGKEVEMRPVPTGTGDIWMAFAAYLPMGAHSESPDNVHPQVVRFCDFSSAGNTWTDESAYRVWLPVELRPWDRPDDR